MHFFQWGSSNLIREKKKETQKYDVTTTPLSLLYYPIDTCVCNVTTSSLAN